jgi:hypothetical protein
VIAPKDTQVQWTVVAPATWPAVPADMSVSAHAEIEECPRRWALSSAEYPELWRGRGYPPRLQVAALGGSVVHLALEVITKQLMRAGAPSQDHPVATQVLRELGGYTRIVEDCVERILKRFADNPRAAPLMEHAQRTLRGQVPTFRTRVQGMLARLHFPAGTPVAPAISAPSPSSSPQRVPLVNGIYSEVELRAKTIGWKGKADLLILAEEACEITDFKTGVADDKHKSQVRVYAVLWRLDDELNPARRDIDRLVLAYDSHDVDVPPPSAQEIDKLAQELLSRRQAAETALAARPPAARPGAETCRYCSVRHLCDAYWTGTAQALSDDGRFGDAELKIVRRHGPTSWDAVVTRARDLRAKAPALLRLQQPVEFKPGTRVRVLDGAFTRDSEDAAVPVIVTLGAFSETYRVE